MNKESCENVLLSNMESMFVNKKKPCLSECLGTPGAVVIATGPLPFKTTGMVHCIALVV